MHGLDVVYGVVSKLCIYVYINYYAKIIRITCTDIMLGENYYYYHIYTLIITS